MSCFSLSVFQSITTLGWSRGSACLNKPARGPSISVTAPPQLPTSPPPQLPPRLPAHVPWERDPRCPGAAAWVRPPEIPAEPDPLQGLRGGVAGGREALGDGAFGQGSPCPPQDPVVSELAPSPSPRPPAHLPKGRSGAEPTVVQASLGDPHDKAGVGGPSEGQAQSQRPTSRCQAPCSHPACPAVPRRCQAPSLPAPPLYPRQNGNRRRGRWPGPLPQPSRGIPRTPGLPAWPAPCSSVPEAPAPTARRQHARCLPSQAGEGRGNPGGFQRPVGCKGSLLPARLWLCRPRPMGRCSRCVPCPLCPPFARQRLGRAQGAPAPPASPAAPSPVPRGLLCSWALAASITDRPQAPAGTGAALGTARAQQSKT